MHKPPRFTLPTVSDEDVSWVCQLLRLPSDAFTGPDGDDPRLEILKSSETLDVEACPGSGKTTLLVAKLAILSRKWTDPRRGLCVLSHTNVARREIEKRLGSSLEGRRLLCYPHFIGTIHGFVNEFLAIPWLRSKAFHIRMIDDNAALRRRWGEIPLEIRKGLERSHHDLNILKISAPDFSVGDVSWGKGILQRNSSTYQAIQAACKTVSAEGYFCYDEMFVWGNELIGQVPQVRDAIRERFPMLFIDEVQDNSELQSRLLFRLFMDGDDSVIRQRFGDANQAIYQHAGQTEGATTDLFPNPPIRKGIPNSHRFGQEIANLANPLALEPQGLVGCGPCGETITTDTAGKHAIFLFADQTVGNVLSTYASHLLEVFSDSELRAGTFTAVGSIHRPEPNDKLPRSVRHYWRDYDPELTPAEARPSMLCQYVQAGRRLARESGESHWLVEKVADGILQLVRILSPTVNLSNRRRKHRYVLELLADRPELRAMYLELVTTLAIDERGPAVEDWCARWSAVIIDIATTIGNTSAASEGVQHFLEWPISDDGDQRTGTLRQHDNVFRYPPLTPKVQIRVGSIHSVKGETHTATLVLDTYYRKKHHLAALRAWLLGTKSGKGSEGPENLLRLKQHYVAMTRPSHLLCLAMREDAFQESELNRLKSMRWRIARVTDGDPMWL